MKLLLSLCLISQHQWYYRKVKLWSGSVLFLELSRSANFMVIPIVCVITVFSVPDVVRSANEAGNVKHVLLFILFSAQWINQQIDISLQPLRGPRHCRLIFTGWYERRNVWIITCQGPPLTAASTTFTSELNSHEEKV